ncbi:MAG: hypothetical protein FJ265_11150, partial [Planctomycetes bacterium]|nr:hypothetical protein [Planctomycetota bacterium]
MRIPPRHAVRLALGIAAAAPLAAQQWQFGTEITARNGAGLAFDVARGRSVLFGGWTSSAVTDETWLFDGSRWQLAAPVHRPSPRHLAALAFDSQRGRTVLFGGVSGTFPPTYYADTWESDGNDWIQQAPVHAPSPRYTALAYDGARARTVLFGGNDGNFLGDTWTYDGVDWTQVATANAPSARSDYALAYDSWRARTVLFGAGSVAAPDTWEFDGTAWVQVQTPVAPVWRRSHGLCFDPLRGRTVLFGGVGNVLPQVPYLADTWEYDGTGWTQRAPVNAPSPQQTTRLCYDSVRQRLLLFGSGTSAYYEANTWTYDGVDWTDWSEPAARDRPALAHDTLRARTVMFGGSNSAMLQDTWEHDGSRWRKVGSAAAPLRLAGAAAAFDPHRARTLLFGGSYLWFTYDVTWEYDGTVWTVTNPAVRPPARQRHAMAYDSARRRTVLFGGDTSTGGGWTCFNDTWEYDGTAWRAITPASILPAARTLTALVFEAARHRVLLFGGTNNLSTAGFSDTWTWDGASWTQLAPNTWPPERHDHGLAYDVQRGRTLLFGGRLNGTAVLADTWEFDGADWSPVTVPASPPPRSCAMVFEQHTGRTLVAGGLDANRQPAGGTLFFAPASMPTFTRHGRGCPGSAGIPVLDRVPPALPALGTSFPLRLSSLPAAPGFALLALGFDLVRWNGAALPTDLAAFGLPCALWIGPTTGK